MKKKHLYIFYTLLFFTICAFPLYGILVYKQPVSAETVTSKRLYIKDEKGNPNINILSDIGEHFSRIFAGRQEMISVNAFIYKNVFGTSSVDNVIVGKNNWLFYKGTKDDYTGDRKSSERGIKNMARTIKLIEEYANKEGFDFSFMMVPNKNTIYPEYMPYYCPRRVGENDGERLEKELQEQNVSHVNLIEVFKDREQLLYFKGDSHWNNFGAMHAQDALLDSLGKEHKPYGEIKWAETVVNAGDLNIMLHPMLSTPEATYMPEGGFSYSIASTDKVREGTELTRKNEGKEGTILLMGDSCGRALSKFIGEEYQWTYYLRTTFYRIDYLQVKKADAFVLEVVERDINRFREVAPIMAAPLRTLDRIPTEVTDSEVECQQDVFENYIKLSGGADARYLDDDSPIYIKLWAQDSEYTYEAFAVNEVANVAATLDYGFTMYIDKEELLPGQYEVEIITEKDNNLVSTKTELIMDIQ